MRGAEIRSDRVRALRLARGLTQEQLAAAADCSARTVRKVESGKGHDGQAGPGGRFDLHIVVGLSEALGCDVEELIAQSRRMGTTQDRNLATFREWHEAILAADLDRLMATHTADTVLEILGSGDLPFGGTHVGWETVRAMHIGFFELFRIREIDRATERIDVVDDLVFHRVHAQIEFLPAGRSYHAWHINELTFRDGLVCHRTTSADYQQLREIIGDCPTAAEEEERAQRLIDRDRGADDATVEGPHADA